MKQFFKMVFATMVGMLLFGLLTMFIGIMCIIGMVSSGNSSVKLRDNSVVVMNLSGDLNERSEGNSLLSSLTGQGGEIGLDDVLTAINKAKDDENVKGLYIEAGMFSADSYASVQAVRHALSEFKKAGKWIVAYADTYTQSSYYLASVADKVYLNPLGQIDWHGIASQPYFLKDLMAKFGVKVQLSKVGAYKSAPEMFTADKMSDSNREQVTAYVNGIWENVVKEVSESRKISVDSLNAYADRLITFEDPQNYVKYKMVDGLLYTDEVKMKVKAQLGLKDDEFINQVGIIDMCNVKSKRSGEEIAVYYAYGDIVDGDAQGIASSHVIDAQVVCKDLEKLMNDEDVKAVVLRVNSGGGSAYASEQIWHQVEMLKAKKPVVVSMGGMAASGGYYISCGSNWIVAEPTTITGSIGIFGMFPDASQLLTEKLGVKFDEVKTNKNSGFGTMARPFNEEEMTYLDNYVERGYELFRSRVAAGRKMSVDDVEAIAQGRVWLGQDALKNKLVDQLGGLDDAVKKAASLAKLSEYHTSSYPGQKSWTEQLFSSMDKGNYLDDNLRNVLGEYYDGLMLLRNIDKQHVLQARVPFYLNVR
ncbi:MAG: signal peptide peptidase SppA [Prevotella sp.]|nr:signal peptide peptidase SppA [Prevotella sp.]